ncbi:MAG: glycosyltransferase [Halofilum sp. (in: g-proteobacteria)]
MNICMLTNTYWPHVGGVARAVETLANECRADGHAVQIIAPGFAGDEQEGHGDVLRVPALQNFNGSDFSVRVPIPRIIAARIEHFAPDVVHAHHPFLLGNAALRIAYENNLPLVFTHHTLYEQYTHYVPFNSPRMQRYVIRLATDFANCCDAVIAPSGSIAGLLRERGVEAPVEAIPTGIDGAAFAAADGPAFRSRWGLPGDAFVLGHVGRLAREKNLHFLVDAVCRALRADARRRFLLVGEGPETEALKDRFARAGVHEQVLATGALGGEELRGAYAAMDLFLFSSQSETQGMVLAEAMAAGQPVVALDGPGVRDVVADGRNGRLLPADSDAGAFAAAVEEGADAERRQAWHEAALETAQLFDRQRCARRVVELYRSLDTERRAAGADWTWWNRLLGRIEAEWELIVNRADSASDFLGDDSREE